MATIADKLIRKVELRLNHEDWPLVITHDVLIECERLTGKPLLAGGDVLRPSARLLQALLYLTLRRAGATYSLKQVGDLITPRTSERIRGAILDAWAASMPDPEPETSDGTEHKTMGWIEPWAIAYEMGMSSQEWLDSTPRQIQALRKRKDLRSQREEYLTAVLAATAANAPHWRSNKPREVEDFMKLYPFPVEPLKPVTGEHLRKVFANFPKSA